MKFEFWIIIIMGFLASSILLLIVIDPQQVPFITNLEQINKKAIEAIAAENENKFTMYQYLMQEKLKKLSSNSLGISITILYLEEGYNFPFKDSSEVKIHEEQLKTIPICEIIPNIPVHLQQIRDSQMFSIFVQKYHSYPIEFIISDERYYNSTVHYQLVATSENEAYSASTWFHVDSCTGKMNELYNLTCREIENNKLMHSRELDEITASLSDDEFCKIKLEPWKQALYDYNQEISNEIKKHFEKLDAIKNLKDNYNAVMAFQDELERLGLLGDLINYAMDNPGDDKKMKEMMQEYLEKFGSLPEKFLNLVDLEQ